MLINLTVKEFRLLKMIMKALASDSLYPLDGWLVSEEDQKMAKRFLERIK